MALCRGCNIETGSSTTLNIAMKDPTANYKASRWESLFAALPFSRKRPAYTRSTSPAWQRAEQCHPSFESCPTRSQNRASTPDQTRAWSESYCYQKQQANRPTKASRCNASRYSQEQPGLPL